MLRKKRKQNPTKCSIKTTKGRERMENKNGNNKGQKIGNSNK